MTPCMWKAPRLTVEGRPFEPALGEVGSSVEWHDYDGTLRTGQVWSLAPPLGGKRAVFVVTPEQESAHIAVAVLHTPTERQHSDD